MLKLMISITVPNVIILIMFKKTKEFNSLMIKIVHKLRLKKHYVIELLLRKECSLNNFNETQYFKFIFMKLLRGVRSFLFIILCSRLQNLSDDRLDNY